MGAQLARMHDNEQRVSYAFVLTVCSVLVVIIVQLHSLSSTSGAILRDLSASAAYGLYLSQFELNLNANMVSVSKGTPSSCPCCGWAGSFESRLRFRGSDRNCPNCGSFERHRRACAYLGYGKKRASHMFEKRECEGSADPSCGTQLLARTDAMEAAGVPFRLLSFGPFKQMETVLNNAPNVDHVGLDFFAQGYGEPGDGHYSQFTLHADVTAIQLPTHFADGILIMHVLEHVPEYHKALKELQRVLKPDSGWLMVEVPCFPEKSTTTVDCRDEDDKGRLAGCGQFDHVWRFQASDFAKSLAAAKWDCYEPGEVEDKNIDFGARNFDANAVWESWRIAPQAHNPLFFCKPPSFKEIKESSAAKKA